MASELTQVVTDDTCDDLFITAVSLLSLFGSVLGIRCIQKTRVRTAPKKISATRRTIDATREMTGMMANGKGDKIRSDQNSRPLPSARLPASWL